MLEPVLLKFTLHLVRIPSVLSYFGSLIRIYEDVVVHDRESWKPRFID
jgi:hypothetical protein